jgi:hypothetical protein
MAKVIFLLVIVRPPLATIKPPLSDVGALNPSIDDSKRIAMRFIFFEYKEESERRWSRLRKFNSIFSLRSENMIKKNGKSCFMHIRRFHSLCRYTQNFSHKHIITKGRRRDWTRWGEKAKEPGLGNSSVLAPVSTLFRHLSLTKLRTVLLVLASHTQHFPQSHSICSVWDLQYFIFQRPSFFPPLPVVVFVISKWEATKSPKFLHLRVFFAFLFAFRYEEFVFITAGFSFFFKYTRKEKGKLSNWKEK